MLYPGTAGVSSYFFWKDSLENNWFWARPYVRFSISSLHNDHTVRKLQCLLTANLWQTDSEANEEKYCEIKHQTRLPKLHQMADLASDFSGRLFGDTLCSPYTLDLTDFKNLSASPFAALSHCHFFSNVPLTSNTWIEAFQWMPIW